jgi:hypothetical protein
MSRGDSNGATGCQVTYPPAVLQELKRVGTGIADMEERLRFTAALRVIQARLRTDPEVFGEHKYPLPHLQLKVRTASVRPVFVRYGVHDERPWVLVLEFKLLGSNEG